ncbi:hypothetical protein K7432_000130 [Basidiobolus ranarum]|uniref:SET domain-containing protein n=1 Tax=Basidiobolus ranarum TaxID=34480 RepID=A0ABR2X545_9FUNG
MAKCNTVAIDEQELEVGSHSESGVKYMFNQIPNWLYAFLFYLAIFFFIGQQLEPLTSVLKTQHMGINSEVSKLYQKTLTLQKEAIQMVLEGDRVPSSETADDRRFYMEDFQEYHQVIPIHTMQVDPLIEKFVNAHDITTDEEYTEDPESSHLLALKYGAALTKGTSFDKRFYVRWVDNIRGYGLFATTNIPGGTILGVYSGILTNNTYTTDYLWHYRGNVLDDQGNSINLGIDSKFYGNWFRFANHHDEPNSQGLYVPYNNKWHVVYVALKTIPADSEISVSYGPYYWTRRTKI